MGCLPQSALVDSPQGRIYFAGDTAYGKHFKSIYDRFGAPKISLLSIGAYEPRWFMNRMHMNPDEAVLAHMDLHSEHSIVIHFGLIDNAGESYEAPVNDLAIARNTHGVEEAQFVAPHLGQVFIRWGKSWVPVLRLHAAPIPLLPCAA